MPTVIIDGDEDLARKLIALSEAMQSRGQALEAAMLSGGLLVANDAKRLAPFRTGTLRRSIHVESDTAVDGRAEVRVGTDLVYAARVEFGFEGTDKAGRTYHQPPQPYLRPALDENIEAATREIGAALREIINQVAKS